MDSIYKSACVAQLVEQRIRNAQVAGSSPAASSTKTRYFFGNNGFLFCCSANQPADCLAIAKKSNGQAGQFGHFFVRQIVVQCNHPAHADHGQHGADAHAD